MAENILEKIIKNKKKKIDLLKKSISIENLKIKIDENKSFINFKEKIKKNVNENKISIIAEIKKASPSAGLIIEILFSSSLLLIFSLKFIKDLYSSIFFFKLSIDKDFFNRSIFFSLFLIIFSNIFSGTLYIL